MEADKDRSMREAKAEDEFVSILLFDDNLVRIQTGDSKSAHVLTTDGVLAPECTCPDNNYSPTRCKHRIAWEEWFVDKVLFEDGTVAWER